jgi:hypothetical protein
MTTNLASAAKHITSQHSTAQHSNLVVSASLRAQRSNLVALATYTAMPQDCRVGFAASQ